MSPASGTTIDTWNDKSGNNRNVAASGTLRPTYNATTGRLEFGGAQRMEATSAPAATTDFGGMLFTVARHNSTRGRVVLVRQATYEACNEHGSAAAFNWFNSSGTPVANPINLTNSLAILSHGRDGAVRPRLGINGGSFDEYGSTGTWAGNGASALTVIGAHPTGDVPLNGEICEVIMYTTFLATPDRQRVEGYLAWKWGLVASLPDGHLYKHVDARTAVT